MHFIHTKDRNNIALSSIVSYAHVQSGEVRAVDARGESHLIDANEFRRALDTAFIGAVPAQPGTYFMTSVTEEDGDTSWDRDTVVAWGILPSGGVVPIGIDGADDVNRAVLFPSGQVADASGSWDSADAFERSQKAREL